MRPAIAVDTNVLVSFLTDRSKKQQAAASDLFERAQRRECELVVHQAMLIELVYVLTNLYQTDASEVRDILLELIDLPFIQVASELSWPQLLGLWPETHADFADAVLATVVASGRADRIASFDRRFTRRLEKRGMEVEPL